MSEYIITDKQLKTATEAYLEHELSRPITEVFISGDKLPEIVRCRDCAKADWIAAIGHGGFTCRVHGWTSDSVDGFCSWGERREK